MILDPHREGCYVWFGNKVSQIKGTPYKICEEIYCRCTKPRMTIDNILEIEQIFELKLDVSGTIGKLYKDILTDFGLEVNDVKAEKIDKILPKTHKYKPKSNRTFFLHNKRYDMYFIK